MEQRWLAAAEDFLAVAAHDGLRAASRVTHIPAATLSRRIRDLEQALGTRLLERGGNRLRLTEEGRYLVERAGPLIGELDDIRGEVADRGRLPRGTLRISVPSLFAQTRLSEIAAGFVGRYPDVTLHIDVADRFVDPLADGYDLVVRVNPAPDTELVGKCFLRSRMVIAAPAALPLPGSDDEEVPAVLMSTLAQLPVWEAEGEAGAVRFKPRPVMICSSMALVHQAALRGAGCALLPRWLVEDDIGAGRLTLWGEVPMRPVEAWVLHTSQRLTSPKVRAFVDALAAAYR
ncbi:MAG TPA: LysR substrate-binding domain-containing protein [Allosphingosinicella sp.]|nr:LysR substrate-binding domain-containing protein [Allosphingosinicella sp.]